MNNFEQVTNLKEQLVNVINNLTIILNNAEKFSAIEKDILLQNLRDAYLAVLKMETAENAPRSCEECQPEKEIAKAEPEPIKEETTPEPEPAPATPETEPEPQTVEPAPQEQPAPKEEPAPQEPVRPEVTKMLNEEEDILDFLSTKISDNSEELSSLYILFKIIKLKFPTKLVCTFCCVPAITYLLGCIVKFCNNTKCCCYFYNGSYNWYNWKSSFY